MSTILNLVDITKSFTNKEVLNGVDLEINRGEIITVLGKSGSGKSTLLNVISGFEKQNSGEVYLNQEAISTKESFLQPEDRNIGFVFQNYALFPHLNIYENITFGIDSKSKEIKKELCKDLLKLIGLEGYEKKYPHETSGGEQQRIALVRSLATEPKLLLLDEPFSNIDGSIKIRIQKELLKILRGKEQTALIVTHDPKEAMSLSDKIVFLEDGKIVQFAPPEEIYNRPKTKSIALTFGMANFIEKEDKEHCVRSEHCVLDKKGEIPCKIVGTHYYGERTLYDVSFRYNSKEYEFHIFSTSGYKEQETMFLTINWDKSWVI